jgi:methionyl-tRNA formyltransferase
VTIAFTDTAFDVFNKVTEAAVKVIGRSWPMLRDGKALRIPMDLKRGSYFGGRKPADGLIYWTKPAIQIYNLIRGVTHPYPGAFTWLEGGRVIIWQAWPVEGSGEPGRIVSQSPLLVGTGQGLLEIRSLQIEGGNEVSAATFVAERVTTAAQFQDS